MAGMMDAASHTATQDRCPRWRREAAMRLLEAEVQLRRTRNAILGTGCSNSEAAGLLDKAGTLCLALGTDLPGAAKGRSE